MAKRNSKGQFVRGGGGHARKRSGGKRRSGGTTAIVLAAPRAPARRHAAPVAHHGHRGGGKRRGGRGGHHRGVTIAKLLAAGVVLGSAAETNTGPAGATVYNLVQKLPGAKTFGGAVTAGLYLGAVGKYTRIGRGKLGGWLRAAGAVGIIGAALRIGAQGTKFQWLGGAEGQPYGDFRVG